MKSQVHILPFTILFFMAVGCVTTADIPSTLSLPTSAPQSNTARVFFLFPQSKVISSYAFIFHGSEPIGIVRNKQYFFYDMPAGKHYFMSYGQNIGNIEAISGDFQGGRTYYIKVFATPTFNMYAANPTHLAPLEPGTENWEERNEWINSHQMTMLNPEVDVLQRAAAHSRDPKVYLEKFKSGQMKSETIPSHYCE